VIKLDIRRQRKKEKERNVTFPLNAVRFVARIEMHSNWGMVTAVFIITAPAHHLHAFLTSQESQWLFHKTNQKK